MGNHIIIRGFPLYGYLVLLLLSVTLLCHRVNVLEVTKYKKEQILGRSTIQCIYPISSFFLFFSFFRNSTHACTQLLVSKNRLRWKLWEKLISQTRSAKTLFWSFKSCSCFLNVSLLFKEFFIRKKVQNTLLFTKKVRPKRVLAERKKVVVCRINNMTEKYKIWQSKQLLLNNEFLKPCQSSWAKIV